MTRSLTQRPIAGASYLRVVAGDSPGMDLPAMMAVASARKDTVVSPAGSRSP